MTVTAYDSIEDMFKDVQSQVEKSNAAVQPWQSQIKEGTYFLRLERSFGIVIYGYVDKLEYEEDKELYASPHMEHFRPARCFSEMCPEGEFGDVHIATVDLIISKEVFDKAKENNWPNDINAVIDLANIQ
ncbi:MAG TPA: hypothetical protein VMX17_12760 [Candidatus Glassbacteria bacterium]|nr:hypothetical protein [Candidatus Glassbacteria bacterium]